VPAPLPRIIIRGSMRLTRGFYSSTVWRRIANRSFDSSRAAIAEERPESRKRVGVGVVLYTRRTLWAAREIVRSTTSTCHPIRALTVCSLS